MVHDHDAYHQPENRPAWWKTPSGIACLFFLAAGAYFLLTEHTAHVVPYLPWLIILLCPLMHFFHHGGHGHGKNHVKTSSEDTDNGGRDA